MTSPERVLARATAKGGSYEASVDGQTVAFTSAEVGHAVAGLDRYGGKLPDGAARILLLRFASGETPDYDQLVRDLTATCPKPKGWIDHAAHARVCGAAVNEFLSTRVCPVCDGTRFTTIDGVVEPCSECDSTGRKAFSTSARARLCGVPLETFRRRAGEAFYLCRLRTLQEWEDMGIRWVVTKTRDADESRRPLRPGLERHLRAIRQGSTPRVQRDVFDHLNALPGMEGNLRYLTDGELGYVGRIDKRTDAAIDELLDGCPKA